MAEPNYEVDAPTESYPLPEQIDLGPPKEQPKQVDLGPLQSNSIQYLLPDNALPTRAFKAFYGLYDTPAAKPMDTFLQAIGQGQEASARDEAAGSLNAYLANKNMSEIASMLSNRDQPLTTEDADAISKIYNQYYNPNNVFEQNYARNYINSLDQFAQKQDVDSFWNVASLAHPQDVAAAKKWGTLALAQRMVAETLKEDVEGRIKNQTWAGAGTDLAKMMLVPGYVEAMMRGLTPDTGVLSKGFFGENLEAQRQELRSLPFDTYTQVLTNVVNKLADINPHLAHQYVDAMIGQTSTEKFLNNMNTFVDLFAVGQIGHGIYNIRKALKEAPGGITIKDAQGNVSPPSKIPEVAETERAVKDVIVSAEAIPSTENIRAATGDLQESAVVKVTDKAVRRIKGIDTTNNDAFEALPAHLRADRDMERANPGSLNTTQANIIEADSQLFENNLMGTIADTLRPQRVPLEAFPRKVIEDSLREQASRYPDISNGILKSTDYIYDPVSNTYETSLWVGRQGGILFQKKDDAVRWGKMHGFNESQVKRYPGQGLGYAIEMKGVKLDETGRVIRDNIVHPDRPESITPALGPDPNLRPLPFFEYLRTSEDTLSSEQRVIRKSGLYPQAAFKAMVQQEAEIIRDVARGIIRYDDQGNKYAIPRYFPGISGQVKKTMWRDFKRMLDLARTTKDPDTGQMGYFFKNPYDLQEAYVSLIGRVPTFPEQRAYFANKRLVEYDRMMRTISMYRNKARLGADEFQVISYGPKPAETPGIGHNGGPALDNQLAELRSVPFDGVQQKSFPSTGNVLDMGADVSTSQVKQIEGLQPKIKNKMKKDVESGKRVLVEVHDPEARPFNGFVPDGHKYVRYVLMDKFERQPIQWNSQVNRLGGGHFVWDYDHYIKQANIVTETVGTAKSATTYRYEGDTTVLPVISRAEGKQIANILDQIRVYLKDGNKGEADKLGAGLPKDFYDKFKAGFYPVKDPEGKLHPPRMNFDEPFHVVPRNASIIQMDNSLQARYPQPNWRDGTKESLMRNFQIEYTQERDSYDMFGPIRNVGTITNPIWNIEPGRMLDPIKTANRALNRIIGTTFMDDVKASAVEAWLQEAIPHMKMPKGGRKEIEGSPYYHFYNPEWLPRTPDEIKTPLMANNFKIRQLMGIPNKMDGWIYSFTQSLYDSAYAKPWSAKGIAGRAVAQLDPVWLLNFIKDPVRGLRTLTFDAMLGMFSVPQFFVQQMGWINISAISPRSTPMATMGMLFEQWTRFAGHPEMIKTLDDVAAKMGQWTRSIGLRGFKPGEFTEFHNLMRQNAYGVVGGEFSMIDNNRVANIIQNGKDRFMDWSRFFFREGERSPRIGSLVSSYLEYREKNPTKKITRAEEQKILDYADLLYGNMSTASHSILHSGPAALMTQFFQYQIRLTEILMSKRLGPSSLGETPAERAITKGRMILANAAAFGIPGAVGISLLPIGDWLRGKAINAGYTPNQHAALDIAMDGLPAWAMAMATGHNYNVGNRYGQQGWSILKDSINSDTNVWRILGGASASLVFNTLGPNKDGLADALGSLARGDYQKYPPKWQDLLDLVQEIRSVSSTAQLIIALNTGQWLNKNKEFVENVSKTDAWFRYVTGLRSQEEADLWPMNNLLKAQEEVEKEAGRRFRKEMNLSLMAASVNDDTAKQQHYNRAVSALIASNMKPDRVAELIAGVYRLNQSLIDRTNFRFFVEGAPKGRELEFLKRFDDIRNRGERPKQPITINGQ